MDDVRWGKVHEPITYHPAVGTEGDFRPGLCRIADAAERVRISQAGQDGQMISATVSGKDLDGWLLEHRRGLLGW